MQDSFENTKWDAHKFSDSDDIESFTMHFERKLRRKMTSFTELIILQKFSKKKEFPDSSKVKSSA